MGEWTGTLDSQSSKINKEISKLQTVESHTLTSCTNEYLTAASCSSIKTKPFGISIHCNNL